MTITLAGMAREELAALLTQRYGEPAFRAKQVFEWIYQGAEPGEMSNLPKTLRQRLSEDATSAGLCLVEALTEEKSATKKYLMRTKDDIIIECVLLRYAHGNTICVSSQAGCRMHCKFCVSGKEGRFRNLTAGEMLSQLILAERDTGEKIRNVVMMGSGEPLDNYEECVKFIRLAGDPKGFGIGIRHFTLSTCGIIPGIIRLIEDGLHVNLAVSLHSPIGKIREEMMPVERAYPIREVVGACREYRERTGRRVTFEYCLVEGLNDTQDCADALAELVGTGDFHINLINVNQGSGAYGKNSANRIDAFAEQLRRRNLNCTVRRKLGSSINAACGQLKSRYETQSRE